MECKSITRIPFKGNNFLAIQKYLWVDPLLTGDSSVSSFFECKTRLTNAPTLRQNLSRGCFHHLFHIFLITYLHCLLYYMFFSFLSLFLSARQFSSIFLLIYLILFFLLLFLFLSLLFFLFIVKFSFFLQEYLIKRTFKGFKGLKC